MRKFYEAPSMDVNVFDTESIVTASGAGEKANDVTALENDATYSKVNVSVTNTLGFNF